MFDTQGYDTHKETVCKRSFHRKLHKPGVCKEETCRHHACHVQISQSGTEYSTKDMYPEETCEKRIQMSKPKEAPKLIKTWAELKECTSETHTLEIEEYNGWIRSKDKKKDDYGTYLSTHTFYGGTHEWSTKTLQACGFNVVIANWDELGW